MLSGSPEMLSRGKHLVERRVFRPRGMYDSIAVLAYQAAELRRVSERGQCSGRCSDRLVEINPGVAVCPRTGHHCPHQRLSLLVALYSKVNA